MTADEAVQAALDEAQYWLEDGYVPSALMRLGAIGAEHVYNINPFSTVEHVPKGARIAPWYEAPGVGVTAELRDAKPYGLAGVCYPLTRQSFRPRYIATEGFTEAWLWVPRGQALALAAGERVNPQWRLVPQEAWDAWAVTWWAELYTRGGYGLEALYLLQDTVAYLPPERWPEVTVMRWRVLKEWGGVDLLQAHLDRADTPRRKWEGALAQLAMMDPVVLACL